MKLFKVSVGNLDCHDCSAPAKVVIEVAGSKEYFCSACLTDIIVDMQEMRDSLKAVKHD